MCQNPRNLNQAVYPMMTTSAKNFCSRARGSLIKIYRVFSVFPATLPKKNLAPPARRQRVLKNLKKNQKKCAICLTKYSRNKKNQNHHFAVQASKVVETPSRSAPNLSRVSSQLSLKTILSSMRITCRRWSLISSRLKPTSTNKRTKKLNISWLRSAPRTSSFRCRSVSNPSRNKN